MFQIKTDIRQYKCETRDKVERLIRNWVIRPSDLIYNDDQGEWNPIGQHPKFDPLFRELEEEESRVPDTVVTSDRPAGDQEESGEVTQLTESPLEDDQEDEDDPPQPPQPTNDVEGLIRDSDEITMMTDKTLDMMRLEDGGGEAESSDEEESTNVVERDEVEPDEEESTNVVERDEVEPDEEESTNVVERDEVEPDEEESTDVVERDEVEEDEDTDVVERDEVEAGPDEQTQLIEADELGADDGEDDTSDREDDASTEVEEDELDDEVAEDEESESDDPDEVEAVEESKGGGRHGLPEDVFVTNEIPSQSAQESVLDELGELDEDDDEFDLDEGLGDDAGGEQRDVEKTPVDRPDSGERRAKWRIVMSEDEGSGDEGDVDEQWEDVAEDLRVTDDLSGDDLDAKIAEERGAPQESLDLDAGPGVEEGGTQEEAEALEESDEADLQEVEVEAVDAPSDDDDLDGLLDDAAELVGVHPDKAGEEKGRQPAETPVGGGDDGPFVSEGYHLDLPIDVGPSKEDLAIGVPRANVSEEIKEATFPYPRPKYPGEAIVRRFTLGKDIVDDDDMADALPDPEDDIDPTAETKPLGDEAGEKTERVEKPERPSKSPVSVPNPSRRSEESIEPPKDQSALIVFALLVTFVLALILAVYFLG